MQQLLLNPIPKFSCLNIIKFSFCLTQSITSEEKPPSKF